MSADVVPIRRKSRSPAAAPPRARVTIVDVNARAAVEYVVSIDYFEVGDTVWAGAFFEYSEALAHARLRGKTLGIPVVDFTGIGPDEESGAS